MTKLLKFLVPVSAVVAATTPLMVSCGNKNEEKYDIDWTYVDTDKSQNQFVPSTPEADLPTEEKTRSNATILYATKAKENNVIMTDDFLYQWNDIAFSYAAMGDAGSYAKNHLTFKGVSLDQEFVAEPMVRLSFKFKFEMYVTATQAGQKMEMKQITQLDITNFPFFSDYAGQDYWMIKPNILISDELTQDHSWKVDYYSYQEGTGSKPKEIKATYDYKIGQASEEKKDEFTNALISSAFRSYYLSKVKYTPDPQP